MTQPGTISNEETIRAWADITLKIWRNKITDLRIYNTGELYNSLINHLTIAAGNDVNKVEFTFKLYGIFVDMGVGREIPLGNSGDLGFNPVRKRKEWYSRIFYREVMKLKEILMEKYGKAVAEQIIYSMKPVNDLKYAHAKGINPQ
ncbi:MAG: hypothetical protein ACOYMF_05580 [Bacteroidales bacterium]